MPLPPVTACKTTFRQELQGCGDQSVTVIIKFLLRRAIHMKDIQVQDTISIPNDFEVAALYVRIR